MTVPLTEQEPYDDGTPLCWDTPEKRDDVRAAIRRDHSFMMLRQIGLHAVDEVEAAYKREASLQASLVSAQEALRPFAEDFDFHAAQYIAGLTDSDGNELRALPVHVVAQLIEHVKAARAVLAGTAERQEAE